MAFNFVPQVAPGGDVLRGSVAPSAASPAMTGLPEENITLEELERFSKTFKRRRIELGQFCVVRGSVK